MELTKKDKLCQDLHGLLAKWDVLLVQQAAIDRDYESLRSQIISICNALDTFDGDGR